MAHPTSHHLHFFDAANSRNIASGLHAGVYINGDFKWEQSEINRMSAIFAISVEREAVWAEKARCIDIETGAALPEDAPGFVKRRGEFLSKKFGRQVNDSVVYVNRSNRQDVEERLQQAGITIVTNNIKHMTAREWVATLDGTDIPDDWATQLHTNGLFDTSILHGLNDFHRV